MHDNTQTQILRDHYHFTCPNRQTIRQAIYHNRENPLGSAIEEAVQAHLTECSECAYETLPRIDVREAV